MEYGLIGEKLSHSFSPEIHSQLTDCNYELKELNENELEGFFKAKSFKGINVTVPYKESVKRFIDFTDEIASESGAVNTVINEDGKLKGYNTDFYGLISLINKSGINVSGKTVLVCGGGGTSKTAVCALKHLKAKEIKVVSRTKTDKTITYEEAYKEYPNAEIIINTTPVGMYPNVEEAPIDLDKFKKLKGVIDVIYNPLNTELLLKAKQKGVAFSNGLYMLVSQAAKSAELFSGKKICQKKTDICYKKALEKKRNIVLIGMPSCGKSTLGKILAKELKLKFVDTDKLVEEKANQKPHEIIKEKGEAVFRKTEAEVIKDLSLKNGLVIATGGGAVLNSNNIKELSRNGVLVFLDRPLDMLAATKDRPLSENKELLNKVLAERYSLYCGAADVTVHCVQDIKKNIKNIKQKLG